MHQSHFNYHKHPECIQRWRSVVWCFLSSSYIHLSTTTRQSACETKPSQWIISTTILPSHSRRHSLLHAAVQPKISLHFIQYYIEASFHHINVMLPNDEHCMSIQLCIQHRLPVSIVNLFIHLWAAVAQAMHTHNTALHSVFAFIAQHQRRKHTNALR